MLSLLRSRPEWVDKYEGEIYLAAIALAIVIVAGYWVVPFLMLVATSAVHYKSGIERGRYNLPARKNYPASEA